MQANYKAANQIAVPSGVISVNHSPFAISVQKTEMVKSCQKIIPFGNCHVQILRWEEVILASSPAPQERAERWGHTWLCFYLKQFEYSGHSAWEVCDANIAPKPKKVLVV